MSKRRQPAPGQKIGKRGGKGYYLKDGRIYFRVKVDGAWQGIRSEFRAGQERAAEAFRRDLEVRLAAGVAVVGELGPVTVAGFCPTWIEERKEQTAGWKNDESAMRLYILPAIGHLRLEEVRPLHLIQIFKSLRKKRAPKTVYNMYSTVCAFFRDACLADLLPRHSSPCILTEHQLGPKMDADPEWRAKAVYTRLEIQRLISDELVPMDRRVFYALESLGALRHGEAAGLRWRLVDQTMEPLGRLIVARSYNNKTTKTKVTRYMPIHPTLAAILSEWKLFGWAQTMGRAPTPDDLVVPLPPTIRRPATEGRMRSKTNSRDRLVKDLAALKLEHRRGHDLRHTFISLASSDGGLKQILRRGTHKAPKEIMEQYTHFEWEVLCRETMKLNLPRLTTGDVVVIPRASAVGDRGFATPSATTETQTAMMTTERRVGPPGFESGGSTLKQRGSASSTKPDSGESASYERGRGRATAGLRGRTSGVRSKVAKALSASDAARLRELLQSIEVNTPADSPALQAIEEALDLLDRSAQ